MGLPLNGKGNNMLENSYTEKRFQIVKQNWISSLEGKGDALLTDKYIIWI